MVPDLDRRGRRRRHEGVHVHGRRLPARTCTRPGSCRAPSTRSARASTASLIVRPAGRPLQANADPATAFDDEALVVIGEIDHDPQQQRDALAVRPARVRAAVLPDQRPGRTRRRTPITTTGGNRAAAPLSRMPGLQHHSMGVLGLRQTIVNDDGSALAAAAAAWSPSRSPPARGRTPSSTMPASTRAPRRSTPSTTRPSR